MSAKMERSSSPTCAARAPAEEEPQNRRHPLCCNLACVLAVAVPMSKVSREDQAVEALERQAREAFGKRYHSR